MLGSDVVVGTINPLILAEKCVLDNRDALLYTRFPMPAMHDDQTSATKQDIRMLMEQMGAYYQKTEERLTSVEQEVKDVRGEVKEMRKNMRDWKDEIIGEFHIVSGQHRHDLIGATKDDLALLKDTDRKHDKRITRLEEHADLIAA